MHNFFFYLIIISAIICPAIALSEDATVILREKYRKSEKEYKDCVEGLPVRIQWGLENPSMRGRRNWSRKNVNRVRICLEKRRLMNDRRAILELKKDLVSFYDKDRTNNIKKIGDEAAVISALLVNTTRRLDKEYKMADVALWHNFLIKIGARDKGYCYHWADALLEVLTEKNYEFFSLIWGVHDKGKITENNAVILSDKRGRVSGGIVYDPWRGKGEPFWRFVEDDSQDWSKRFGEAEIRDGIY